MLEKSQLNVERNYALDWNSSWWKTSCFNWKIKWKNEKGEGLKGVARVNNNKVTQWIWWKTPSGSKKPQFHVI